MKLRLAAIAVALVALGGIVVVLAGGRDGDEEAVVLREGLPEAGFPLRGALADDEALHAQAVASWRDRATRDGDDWAGTGDDVSVLWAGEADGDTLVVASAGSEAALMRRSAQEADSADPYWEVSTAPVDRFAPGVVAFERAVLVPQGADAVFRPAQSVGEGGPPPQDADGLWTDGGRLRPGALILPGGVQRIVGGDPTGPVAVFTGDRPVVRELGPDLAGSLTEGEASRIGGEAQRVLAAVRAGGVAGASPTAPQTVERIGTGTTDAGEVTVLATSSSDTPRAVLSAGVGGEGAAGEEPFGVSLGGEDAGGRAQEGPAFGAAYVTTGDGDDVFLLVGAGDDVRSAEVRAGRETFDVAPPVTAVRADWVTDAALGTLGADVAVLGRTAGGDLVVADVAPSLQAAG